MKNTESLTDSKRIIKKPLCRDERGATKATSPKHSKDNIEQTDALTVKKMLLNSAPAHFNTSHSQCSQTRDIFGNPMVVHDVAEDLNLLRFLACRNKITRAD